MCEEDHAHALTTDMVYSHRPLTRPCVSLRRPLARTTTFVQVWSNHPQAAGPAGAIMDTAVLGTERGLTFWRPRPPIGYAALGDCVTTGTMQPTFQVSNMLYLYQIA